MKAPIQSTKHYVMHSLTTTTSGAVSVVTIADSAVTRGVAQQDVVAGSVLKAVYVEIWHRGSTVEGAINIALMKIPGSGTNPTFAETANYNDYENKKNILYMTQGITGDDTTTGIPALRQWFKIPKGKQRFGLGDRLILIIAAIGVSVDTCGFATYKEYN